MFAGCLPLLVLFIISVAIGKYFGKDIGAAFFWSIIFLGWIATKFENKKEQSETKNKTSPSKPALKSQEVKFKQATSKPPLSPPSPSPTFKISSDDSDYSSKKRKKSSNVIEFTYTNAQGETSEREVWVDSVDGIYIKGYCYTAGDTRTFRLDRIEGMIWQNNKSFFVDEWLEKQDVKSIPRRSPTSNKSRALEICFTGFSKADREHLENLAEIYDFKVRKTVTKNLNFLVTGDNAGSTKISAATDVGAMLIDEYEFKEMVETGEIPQ